MRIGHVNLSREFRGGERQTIALIQQLAPHVEQYVVVRRDGLLHRELGRQARADVEIRPVTPLRIAALSALSGADVVHVHEGRSVVLGAARSLVGAPFIVTRRAFRSPSPGAATRACYGRATAIVGVSDLVSGKMRSYVAGRCPVLTIYDGAPMLPSAQQTVITAIRERFAGRIIVGQVGQLDDAAKGQRLTLDAARALEGRYPELVFLLVGEGKDEATLRAEAAGLSNVHFAGWTADIANYYAAMDVLVYPSRFEALGSAMLEAMSFEVPVVASSVGGIPEIVSHGINGMLFRSGEVDEYCDRLVTLAADPQLRRQLGHQGKRTAERLSAKAMADQYLRLYRETAVWRAGIGSLGPTGV